MKKQETNLKDIKKFNFKGIKGMLTRDQMKQVKGGSGGCGPSGCSLGCVDSQGYCSTCCIA